MRVLPDFHCQVCDGEFERISLPGNHIQRRRVCEPCREWFSWCNTCKKPKLISEFARNAGRSDNRQTRCNECLVEQRGRFAVHRCGHCADEFMVRRSVRDNGQSLWLCDTCFELVKHCRDCDRILPLDQFNLSRDKRNGRACWCRECVSKRWAIVDGQTRSHAKRRKRGLSHDEYEQMKMAQDNRCAICGSPETDRRRAHDEQPRELAIDHDHATGLVRALLCGRCNKAIGLMLDDSARLRAAADYLERFRA